MANVKLFKMGNGEELLATVKEEPSLAYEYYTLTDVIKIVYYDTEKGIQTGFSPYLPMAEEKNEYKIKESFIICVVEPKQAVLSEYSRIFTGLVVPQKSGIII